jgi:LPS O-antigen subunit length determinant protein (WzzB/FepE family)
MDRGPQSGVTPANELETSNRKRDLATLSKEARERAEQKFKKKEIEARDASKAMAEYQAGLVAQREKTARLRALREAKEAAERAAIGSAQTPAGADAGEAGETVKSRGKTSATV